MESIEQYNDEQFQMLCLSVMDTTSGICLFQTDYPEWQSSIAYNLQKSIGKSSCVLDMSRIESQNVPDEIGKLEQLLEGHEEDQVVVLCNIQVCGAISGDVAYIQKLNYMRDQMLARGKVWVLGMSPYFSVLLSREARDLYSCIMNHFTFQSYEEEEKFSFGEVDDYTGDIRLELSRFREFKNRMCEIEIEHIGTDILLEIITSWNRIYDYNYQKSDIFWLRNIAEVLQIRMKEIEFSPVACMRYQEVAMAWYHMEQYQNAIRLELHIAEQAQMILPKHDIQWAEIYRRLGIMQYQLGNYEDAEDYLARAGKQYVLCQGKFTGEQARTLDFMAKVKVLRGKIEEAVEVYQKIIASTREWLGENYYYLVTLWNNLGTTYYVAERYSEALQCYLQANDDTHFLSSNSSKKSKINLRKNIGKVYARIGNYSESIKYLEQAEKMLQSIGRSRWKNRMLIDIYQTLASDYQVLGQEEMAAKYQAQILEMREKVRKI